MSKTKIFPFMSDVINISPFFHTIPVILATDKYFNDIQCSNLHTFGFIDSWNKSIPKIFWRPKKKFLFLEIIWRRKFFSWKSKDKENEVEFCRSCGIFLKPLTQDSNSMEIL